MKKFLQEFKEFALQGNVMSMAVGVIVGAAFKDLVTSFTDNVITPIINCIGGAEIQGRIHLLGDQYINYGAFITAIINFLIMAFIIFLMVKGMNNLANMGKKKEEAVEEATTKECPYCKSEIHKDATKCPHCASEV
ncbi:MAG: large conductance mechanosensitive channel protein MscL [Lachnospiraceae bacterium]|nr:large conductance mechanosensitive channel protein MscL [Lachnospiraceae bacterium]